MCPLSVRFFPQIQYSIVRGKLGVSIGKSIGIQVIGELPSGLNAVFYFNGVAFRFGYNPVLLLHSNVVLVCVETVIATGCVHAE